MKYYGTGQTDYKQTDDCNASYNKTSSWVRSQEHHSDDFNNNQNNTPHGYSCDAIEKVTQRKAQKKKE